MRRVAPTSSSRTRATRRTSSHAARAGSSTADIATRSGQRIYGNQELWDSFPPEDFERVVKETNALQAELRASGEFVGAWGVGDQVMAKTVHLDNGVPVVTDGPYIESKEKLGGFWIIKAPDLDAALVWARDGSAACQGPVEVRPFQEEPEA